MSATHASPDSGADPAQLACPYCQEPQQISIVSSISRDDQALVNRLFEGNINRARCSKCERLFAIDVPVVFRDDPKQYLLYFLPLAEPGRWAEAESQMEELTTAVFAQEQVQKPTCRLVISQPTFVEKVALHLDGLDDRLIEYIKYQLYNRGDQSVDAVRQELLYDFSNSDKDKLTFVIFDRETTSPTANAHIPREVYDELKETFLTNSGLRKELDALFPGTYVSVERLFFDED